jgi:hypothetical protein
MHLFRTDPSGPPGSRPGGSGTSACRRGPKTPRLGGDARNSRPTNCRSSAAGIRNSPAPSNSPAACDTDRILETIGLQSLLTSPYYTRRSRSGRRPSQRNRRPAPPRELKTPIAYRHLRVKKWGRAPRGTPFTRCLRGPARSQSPFFRRLPVCHGPLQSSSDGRRPSPQHLGRGPA